MTELIIPFYKPEAASQANINRYIISTHPWHINQTSKCEVFFTIFHDDENIYLNFTVKEQAIRAQKRPFNNAVHLDNCVEFFIAFNNEAGYYNFEFNCLGSVKAAYGTSRKQRKYLSAHVLQQVTDQLSLTIDTACADALIKWKIGIKLPLSVFSYHQFTSLSKLPCAVNFTKCGDNLPAPHYLSWVDIYTPRPDFHQRSFFAEALFAPSNELINS